MLFSGNILVVTFACA